MYVDKVLSGVKAVQTLSRLNRAHPQKHDTFVLDFMNDAATIEAAFADYYDPGTADSGTLQVFLYDARGQLTKAPTYLGVAPTSGQKLPNRQHEFTYDNIGNRASSNSTSDAVADTYTTNALNQYTARDNKRVYVSGTADAGAKVVVTQPTTTLTATLEPKNPLGRYWSDRLAVPNERVFINLHKYGNTSAASIAIAMDEANRTGAFKRGEYIVLVAFGAGLTWAAAAIRW
ncbi:MAG: 3-oxoacyl-[acyl-carrier-protein] synthase III C-terminal domain-containing protein, partial [Verrucomicrobiota bacterium]